MAHYALLNEFNIVVRVITGQHEDGSDWEGYYAAKTGLGCKRTSYNTRGGVHVLGGVPFRMNYAAPGYYYDTLRDAFVPPQPFPSWTLNEDTCLWQPPVPRPEGQPLHTWDETNQQWVPIITA